MNVLMRALKKEPLSPTQVAEVFQILETTVTNVSGYLNNETNQDACAQAIANFRLIQKMCNGGIV